MAPDLTFLSTDTLQKLRVWASRNHQSSSTWSQFREAAWRWSEILGEINAAPRGTINVIRADAATEFDDVQEAFLRSLSVIRKLESVSQKLATMSEAPRSDLDRSGDVDDAGGRIIDFLTRRMAHKPRDEAIISLIAVSDRLHNEFGDSVEAFHGKAEILSAKLRAIRR